MSGTSANSPCSMSSRPHLLSHAATAQPAHAAGRGLRHSRRGWISFHDCHHSKVGGSALAWLEQLLHGEIWLHAFRAYWATFEQACQPNLSNKPPSAHARPRGHPRIIRAEPSARLSPGIWLNPEPGRFQHMPEGFSPLRLPGTYLALAGMAAATPSTSSCIACANGRYAVRTQTKKPLRSMI